MKPLLQVSNLSISFKSEKTTQEVVKGISFNLFEREIIGIVGESGSGKSVTVLGLLKLLPNSAKIVGNVLFEGKELTQITEKEYQKIRGNAISMIFQEPMSSLNPSLTCGYQVFEILLQHTSLSKKEAKKEVLQLFEKVKLPQPELIYKKYPHQISGGQKQRVMIAMAIACKPKILIADEPTTALDVTVQKEIILLLKELQQEFNMSIIFITHDLALVSEIADRIMVMFKGEVVEEGTAVNIFKNPKHNYTRALINSRPKMNERMVKLPTVTNFISNSVELQTVSKLERIEKHKKIYSKSPILEVKNIATYFNSSTSFFNKKTNFIKAVDGVTFQLFEGETLGLVGESGCGKTTLGRTILHLEKATKGTIFYKNKDVTNLSEEHLVQFRKEVQIIFQDPYSSLNPRITVGEAIIEPMQVHNILSTYLERKQYVINLLEKVGLAEEHFYRYPHEFSGGQRQRIGIARTIVLNPKIIICDESVSALDVSVQAQVLNLLNELKNDFGFTYIFISHDLAVVKYMADQLVVMNKGKIEEIGEADSVYQDPKTEYSKKLIKAIPKGI